MDNEQSLWKIQSFWTAALTQVVALSQWLRDKHKCSDTRLDVLALWDLCLNQLILCHINIDCWEQDILPVIKIIGTTFENNYAKQNGGAVSLFHLQRMSADTFVYENITDSNAANVQIENGSQF